MGEEEVRREKYGPREKGCHDASRVLCFQIQLAVLHNIDIKSHREIFHDFLRNLIKITEN